MSVLRTLMARKKLDGLNKSLEELRAKKDEFAKREEELTQAIAEAETEEEQKAVEESVDALEAEKKENEEATAKLEGEIAELEGEIADAEKKQEESRKAAPTPETRENTRKEVTVMNRTKFFGMSAQERDAFFGNEGVKDFLGKVRSVLASGDIQTRAISGADLLIPDEMLGLIRENIENYSKLIGIVNLRRIGGTARQNISGGIPEAVWTEACAVLNELSLRFYQTEIDGYKVGGYIAICNATLEDSDINLATEIINALSKAIGLALDKAILYGTGTKMPVGIVTRLVQTSKPSGYSNNDRPWVNLSTTNIISIASSSKAVTLYQEIITASSNASNKYASGQKFWVMNEKTKAYLVTQALTINAAGAIVSGQGNTMPVVGGNIITLEFVPDNVIICGYGENYLLGERAGTSVAVSTDYKFIEDQTVYKATARYDGKPVIAEAFVAIGINGVTPDATMTFAADTANTANAS